MPKKSLKNDKRPSDPLAILLSQPLYSKLKVQKEVYDDLLNFKEPVDTYCLECGRNSIFNREDRTPRAALAGLGAMSGGGFTNDQPTSAEYSSMIYYCGRHEDHKLRFYFRWDQNTLQKIGEFPSRSDREGEILKKYKRDLKADYDLLVKSLYLYSSDLGIGSIAYLRRIFENILRDTASTQFKDEKGWTWSDWRKGKRVSDIVEELKEQLPDFLTENTKLYPVLSKGLHELEEEECLIAYPILLDGIKEILDDKINQRAKGARRQTNKRDVSDLAK